MDRIEIIESGEHIAVKSPYHPDFPSKARQLGGTWSKANRWWKFDARDTGRVRDLCRDIYGTDGTHTETVTLRVCIGEGGLRVADEQEVYFAGRLLMRRRYRDSDIELGPGVVLVDGELLPSSGGSRKNPRLSASKPRVLEIRDVPALLGTRLKEERPRTVSIASIEADVQALRVEREQLLQRLAEIDALLEREA